MSEWWFQVQPMIQWISLIYFCTGLLRELGDSAQFFWWRHCSPSFLEMGTELPHFWEYMHLSSMLP